jgi:GT2 family glycosyltransferase
MIDDPSIDVLYAMLEMFKVQDPSTLTPAAGHSTKIIRGPYLQSAMFRPTVFRKVGPFDESFRQGDDTDFVLRIIDHGFNIALDDGLAAYYRRHDTNVTLDVAEMRREFLRATVKFAVRRRRSGNDPAPPAVFLELCRRRDQIEN